MNITMLKRKEGDFKESVNPLIIQKIIESYYGEKGLVSRIDELGSGNFNSTYKILLHDNVKLILRVAPHISKVFNHERYLLRRECNVSSMLYKEGFTIPKIVYSDFSHELLNRDFTISTYIEGATWGELKKELSYENNKNIYQQLDQIIAQANQIIGEFYGFPKPNLQYANWHDAVLSYLLNLVEDIAKLNLINKFDDIEQFIKIIQDHSELFGNEVSKPTLALGDIWPNNVIIKKNGSAFTLTGVIDLERSYWGDQELDYTFLKRLVAKNEHISTTSRFILRQFYLGIGYILCILESTRGWKGGAEENRVALSCINRKVSALI